MVVAASGMQAEIGAIDVEAVDPSAAGGSSSSSAALARRRRPQSATRMRRAPRRQWHGGSAVRVAMALRMCQHHRLRLGRRLVGRGYLCSCALYARRVARGQSAIQALSQWLPPAWWPAAQEAHLAATMPALKAALEASAREQEEKALKDALAQSAQQQQQRQPQPPSGPGADADLAGRDCAASLWAVCKE